ncbi:unnamed protein product, partial [Amoebophrya sp. A25]|eukprot:GSA25T00001236001.1
MIRPWLPLSRNAEGSFVRRPIDVAAKMKKETTPRTSSSSLMWHQMDLELKRTCPAATRHLPPADRGWTTGSSHVAGIGSSTRTSTQIIDHHLKEQERREQRQMQLKDKREGLRKVVGLNQPQDEEEGQRRADEDQARIDQPHAVDLPQHTLAKKSSCHLRMMHWNILADCLATRERFPDCSPRALDFGKHRLRLILQEIAKYLPDVVSLVEVDHFPRIKREMEALGYSASAFGKKKSPAKDGVCLFWRDSPRGPREGQTTRRSSLRISPAGVERVTWVGSQVALAQDFWIEVMKEDVKADDRVEEKQVDELGDDIEMTSATNTQEPSSTSCRRTSAGGKMMKRVRVATTHLKADPLSSGSLSSSLEQGLAGPGTGLSFEQQDCDEARVAQVSKIVDELLFPETFAAREKKDTATAKSRRQQQTQTHSCEGVPVILCGDINAVG